MPLKRSRYHQSPKAAKTGGIRRFSLIAPSRLVRLRVQHRHCHRPLPFRHVAAIAAAADGWRAASGPGARRRVAVRRRAILMMPIGKASASKAHLPAPRARHDTANHGAVGDDSRNLPWFGPIGTRLTAFHEVRLEAGEAFAPSLENRKSLA
jgi:hypothetical protein